MSFPYLSRTVHIRLSVIVLVFQTLNGRVQARCEAQRSNVACKSVLGRLALDLRLLHIVMNCINCIGDTVFRPYSRTNLGRLGLHVWVVESGCDDAP